MNFNWEPNNDNKDPLKEYGRNLTDLAIKNKLDPVINRDDEIRRIIRILSRKTKNNPVLVGEPGVGKTAIIEGFARKIVEGQVPENLKGKEVWEIDLTSLVAGASYKGEFEGRLKKLLKRIEETNGEVIVFIDEIHMLIGAGKSEGAMDAANILKPMMARGQIKLIGATTIEEYRKYIETDAALERRMQKVDVNEPSIEDTITILRGIKDRFENYHGVKIQDSALISAANLSARYISDRFLPDKAIDLVDEAAATIKVEMNYQPEMLDKAQQKLAQLEMERIALKQENKDKARIEELNNVIDALKVEIKDITKIWHDEKQKSNQLAKYKQELDDLKNKQFFLQGEGKYKEASEILYVKIPATEEKLKQLEKEMENNKNHLIKENVTEEEIANIVSKWTKIPVNKLIEKQREKLLTLETNLKQKVKGQERAIELVSQAILRSKANINDPNKPIGSFMFMGSTGVGKTELARALAYNLFDSEDQMIRLDMSEYMEKHSVSRLIGSPPGYIGFEEGGQLTEKIRQNPYSIVLFDEIEKAHPDVVNVLLQILDNGSLSDSKGRKINFRNTIIILTTNIGSEKIMESKDISTIDLRNLLMSHFRPEFINRLDEIIAFNPLSKEVVNQIIKLELNNLIKRVEKSNDIKFTYNEKLINFINESAYDVAFGARPIKHFIKRKIESKIALDIISETIRATESFIIDVDDKSEIVFRREN